MNNEKDKGLDDLFRKKLEDPLDQIRYEETDWDALEQMLDKGKRRRRIVYLWPVLSGVAALLLLFSGWWVFHPQVVNHNGPIKLQAAIHPDSAGKKQADVKPLATDTGLNNLDPHKAAPGRQKVVQSINYANNLKINKSSTGKKSVPFLPAQASGINSRSPQTEKAEMANIKSNEALFAVNQAPVFASQIKAAEPVKAVDLLNGDFVISNGSVSPADQKDKLKSKTAFRPQYALTVLAAPDVNGVGSFQQAKVGTNIGLQFSANVLRKLTVTTGALYSDKPYITGFGNYHTPYQFSTDPTSVTADCSMLDIPVNVAYQIYNKNQNKISFGTGLSSYIMLHQNYEFNYASSTTTGPAYFNVPNNEKYLLSVLNLNATYDHQINSKVGIEVQPYFKLPLTNIGYSQVKLQTTGVAVGIRWNLNSIVKP